jgi:PAS domain S-box-containing protein
MDGRIGRAMLALSPPSPARGIMLDFLKKVVRSWSRRTAIRVELSRTAGARLLVAGRGLRHSEEEFAQLVAGVRDYAVFLLDREGNVLTWNSGAESIKGYEASEIIGSHFSCFYPPEAVSAGWPAHELEVAAATGGFEDEGWRIRKDGSRFWANVVITALRDQRGQTRGFLKITRDLTERKQNEERLRLSEERFRLLVEGVKDYAILMLGPAGNIATWNAGAERLYGYRGDEISGQHFSRFYPADAIQRGWPDLELRRARAEGQFEDQGWRIKKDGTQFWANVVITAMRHENGTLLGFSKVTRDLTAKKQAEETERRLIEEEATRLAVEEVSREIERQRQQLHVTLSSIGDAVLVTDEHGTVTFMNPVAVKLTGWETDDAAGRPLQEVFRVRNENTHEAVDNPVSRVLQEGTVVGLGNHTVLVSKNGTEIPIDDSGAPIRDEAGNIVGVVLVFRDVTETRRDVEARLRLAAIVESSDDAIIGQTLDGGISSWNKGAERLFGYTALEIIGRPLSVLVPGDHPDELPVIMEKIKRGEYIEHFETERVRKDGSRMQMSLTISPVRNAEGEIIGASKIARDITERKRAERALRRSEAGFRQLAEALKEEDRRKNEFLALLAHELRNPLAPLRNGLEVLRLAGNAGRSGEEARTMMERQLQQLVRLVDDLLDLSRISQGKIGLRKAPLTLRAAVVSAIESSRPLLDEKGDELIVNLPESPIYIDGDKARLAQVISNLLNNAAKYSSPRGQISLTVTGEDGEALINVRDKGIGIPAHLLPRVFDMFMQIEGSLNRSQGGLGVGLTIVRRLVELHGGSVEARSEGEGRGSEFIIRLPTVAGPAEEPGPTANRPVGKVAGHRVLIADDNADAADSLAMMLRIMGNEVRTAHDGQAAVEVAADFRPDVILLDIGMPRLSGHEACGRIRALRGGKDAHIVALTGWGQKNDRVRSRQAGFDGHLVKPIEPAALEKLLAELSSRPEKRSDRQN